MTQAAAPHASWAAAEEGVSSHRRSAQQLLRVPSLCAIVAALLFQAPTATAFFSTTTTGVRQLLPQSRSHRGAATARFASPTCTISIDPATLVRLAGQSAVHFRDLGFRTWRGGKVPPHEQALKSKDDLAHWLETYAECDLSLWGVGKAKEPKHLLKELRQGESFLREDGKRAVKVAKVRVFDGDYELVEVSQILGAKLEQGVVSGGIVKERHGRHLAEKFKPGETPLQACGRGIVEELEQVVGNNPAIHVLNDNDRVPAWEEEEVSTSYPGLSSVYQLYFMECEVEGLNRVSTGMKFFTGEDCTLDGHCDKVHVWQWRKRKGTTQVPAGCKRIDATLWSLH